MTLKTKTVDAKGLPELLTIHEVSNILKCTPTTLRNWDKNGTLKPFRIGKRNERRYRKEDIENFINKKSQDPTNHKELKDELQLSEIRYKTLTNLAPVGIFETDASGDCLFVNTRWREIAGLTPEQARGRGWVKAIHPDDKDRVFREWYEAAEAQKEFVSEYRFRTRKGKVTWVHGTGVSLMTKGQVTGYIGTIVDITDKKQDQEKLRESETRFRILADSSPTLMWVNGLKGCEFVNKAYLEFLGVNPEDVTKFDWAQFIHPDDRQIYVDLYLKVFKKREIFQAQFRFRRADKQYRWMKSVGLPRYSVNGEFQGYVGSTFDITDLKEAEHEARKATAIIDSSDDAIISLDKKGTITSWNKGAEQLYGYTRKEVLGKTTALLMPPDKKDDFPMIMKQLRLGRSIDHYETQRMTNEGLIIDVSITISPIKDENGQVIGASKIARDITERRKLEQRKDDFIALASHELKTPVTSLKMFSQVLEQRFKKVHDTQSAKSLSTMNKQLDKLTELVNSLLDLSRMQQGKLEYKKDKFFLDDLVHETVESLQRITSSHKILTVGQTKQKIVADKDRIGQVLINLINNAIKYSPHSDKVVVNSKKERDYIILSVTDYGVGIPKSEHKKVFERFFQVNNPTVKTYPGLGLGLYISREIVNRHGGKIWCESRVGKGTTFYFSLPIIQTKNQKRKSSRNEK